MGVQELMEPFRVHTGNVVPLDRANVDTDQIIPKQFLKRVERSGYGGFLFHGWRYRSDGSPDPAFILNEPRFAGASILLAGRNFGCGSSREHAPWALAEYGFRAIIAPSFADIFANNCSKNGILTCQLPDEQVGELMRRAQAAPGYRLTIDLENCTIRDDHGFTANFSIDDFRRKFLLEGLDDIGLTLKHVSAIDAYEKRRPAWASPAADPDRSLA
jgi:3-isopropylmalate/(R)-2-methylmalate dehydratase small subunit